MNATLAELTCWECGQSVPDSGPCPNEHPGFSLRSAMARGYVYATGAGEVHTIEGFARRRNERAEENEMAVREAQIATIDQRLSDMRAQREWALDVLRAAQAAIATLEVRRDFLRRSIRPGRFSRGAER